MADPSAPPQTLKYSLTNKTFWFSTQVQGWSVGNLSQCRLFDQFQVTPGTSGSDFELKLTTQVMSCVWAKKGDLWLQSSLGLAGSFSTASGASGSAQLNTGLYWQPMKEITMTFGITLDGMVDSNGFNGSVHFHDTALYLAAPKTTFGAVGIHF